MHLLALVLLAFLLLSSCYLALYRPAHFCRLETFKTSTAVWDDNQFDGYTLQQGWAFDNYVIWGLVIVGLLNAFCFSVIAFSAFSLLDEIQKQKACWWVLCIATITGVVFASLTIYWAVEGLEWFEYPHAQ